MNKIMNFKVKFLILKENRHKNNKSNKNNNKNLKKKTSCHTCNNQKILIRKMPISLKTNIWV